ncbi:hypothetical protein TCSYLVIO_002556 [Trypanosoma cruzi]|nr:hypothetical protein TCSYLVIO_002556 [Trypanosoma cruzi]
MCLRIFSLAEHLGWPNSSFFFVPFVPFSHFLHQDRAPKEEHQLIQKEKRKKKREFYPPHLKSANDFSMFRVSQISRMAPCGVLYNKGKVISWMSGRGFGFIEDDTDKKQHFVHFSALQTETGGFRSLTVGQEVEFEVASQDGRTRAENVTAPGGSKLPSGPRPPEGMGRGRGGGGRGRGGGGRGFGGSGGRGGGENYQGRGNQSLSDDF